MMSTPPPPVRAPAQEHPEVDVGDVLTLAPGSVGDDLFTAPSHWMPSGRAYGGQLIGQSALAAEATLDPHHRLVSLQGQFVRPGDVTKPVDLAVLRLRDDDAGSLREVRVSQEGRLQWTALCIARADVPDEPARVGPGARLSRELPPHAATAEGASLHIDRFSPVDRLFSEVFDLRLLDDSEVVRIEPGVEHAFWMRLRRPLAGEDPGMLRAAVAYCSDYRLVTSVLVRHGVDPAVIGLRMASLDHSVWWHAAARIDEWLLYTHRSPSLSGGRGLVAAEIHDEGGRLVANVLQEILFRVPGAIVR